MTSSVPGFAEPAFLNREVKQDVRLAAQFDVPVLISARRADESEFVASLIHRTSQRAPGRFLTVSCGSLTPASLEAALFGTPPAAGLLEQANGGTLFLEQVEAMGTTVQRRLHAFLDGRTLKRVGAAHAGQSANVRLIAATCRNLFGQVQQRRFRPELFYRLNMIHIVLPTGPEGDLPGGPVR